MNRSTPVQHIKRATMADTLHAMRAAALEGKKDLEVRRLVEQITDGIAQGDYSSEALALYYWVCKNIRYIRDIDGVEFLKIPRQLLRNRAGDCDDIATLLAAMLMAAGNPVQFAIAGFRPGRPNFSHVYVEMITPHGVIAIDPVANRVTERMLKDMKHKKTFPVSKGPGAHDAGIGAVGSLRHMGPQGGNVYSVYDYHRGMYDYYEGTAGSIPATGRHRKPSSKSNFGAAPEAIAAPLPSTAQKVGEGDIPKGIIASKKGFGMFSGISIERGDLIWFAFGMGVGWWLWAKSKRWS